MASNEPVRCFWAQGQFPEYIAYHDHEWGVPVHDDIVHFEFLILEGAQAGLSWATVLKRREGYRNAFADFDPKEVASFPEEMVEELMQDKGIIRNRLKIKASINNARRFLEIQKEFGSFDHYIWSFVDHSPITNSLSNKGSYPATSPESDALSKDLKKRGFGFVGSTIIYAHMQACGLVNDHVIECFRHQEVKNLK
jgi:DNA-3-methyladenine glycosylase I